MKSFRTVKAHIPNIHALNSDNHTLRIQYEYTKKPCVGVAIEGMDIWYMGLIREFFIILILNSDVSKQKLTGLPASK